MDLDAIYENIDIQDSTGPQTQNHKQDEEKHQNQRRKSRCVLVMMVSLGLICVLLVVFITLQYISITAEIDLYKNTVEELNHTISSLQHNNTDLKTEKHRLKNDFSSLSLEKLVLERNIITLRDELKRKTSKLLFFPPSGETKSWSESRQYCRDRGADLVTIKSEEKQRFITSLVKETVWIGLSEIETEGNLKWVDNSPLNQGFWSENEPNNFGGDEDCIELRHDKPILNWNDQPCSQKKQWICEN